MLMKIIQKGNKQVQGNGYSKRAYESPKEEQLAYEWSWYGWLLFD